MHKKINITKEIGIILAIFIFTSFFYILTIKNNFVSSVERGRYALMRAIVEEETLRIDSYKDFSAPDLSMKNGHYYSRFPAGMAFMISPFHFIAREVYSPKPYIIHFIVIAIISALTICLFYIIGRLGDFPRNLSFIVSIAYAFSTLIFSFSGGFWSHILSVFFISLSLIFTLLFIKKKSVFFVFLFGLSFALSVSIDFPNTIILSPLFLFLIFTLYKLSVKKLIAGIFLFILPCILIAGLISVYNMNSFGSPLKIGQSATSSVGSRFKESVIPMGAWNAQGVFDDRRLFPGIISQTVSPERGLLFFSPVLLVALLGFLPFYRRNKYLAISLFTVFGLNIIFYAVWQDYWGGWSYGPRYLIASIPALVLPLLYFLRFAKNKLFAEFLFCISAIWGIAVNSLGAFSGSILPCPCEGYIGIWYSPLYALARLSEVSPNSFFFNSFFKDYVSPYYFLIFITGFLSLSFLLLTYFALRKDYGNEN